MCISLKTLTNELERNTGNNFRNVATHTSISLLANLCMTHIRTPKTYSSLGEQIVVREPFKVRLVIWSPQRNDAIAVPPYCIRAQELIDLKLELISSHTCSCRLVCLYYPIYLQWLFQLADIRASPSIYVGKGNYFTSRERNWAGTTELLNCMVFIYNLIWAVFMPVLLLSHHQC